MLIFLPCQTRVEGEFPAVQRKGEGRPCTEVPFVQAHELLCTLTLRNHKVIKGSPLPITEFYSVQWK